VCALLGIDGIAVQGFGLVTGVNALTGSLDLDRQIQA
jgi:hypothetical protein